MVREPAAVCAWLSTHHIYRVIPSSPVISFAGWPDDIVFIDRQFFFCCHWRPLAHCSLKFQRTPPLLFSPVYLEVTHTPNSLTCRIYSVGSLHSASFSLVYSTRVQTVTVSSKNTTNLSLLLCGIHVLELETMCLNPPGHNL